MSGGTHAEAVVDCRERQAATPPGGWAVYPATPPAPARTLLDVFTATVRTHPGAAALDDGQQVLSYRECARRADALSQQLRRAGIGPGDRVGLRMPSGQADLYLAVLAILAIGAAYVPVDADDPDDRAEQVWREADVRGVLGSGARFVARHRGLAGRGNRHPEPSDDAWVIFTSGSTGRPKGVAITHRSAAAFVDAEAELFLAERPLAPGDRVLAGLSVAFDASCEEMWLAWRHGACLVPAPRALVRAGAELGPWLIDRAVTVVSTVPTLAALWPAEALAGVRLLILGGEACPGELARRLAAPHREVWNTYGPTETTVVACAARLDGREPVRIGLPLRGWQLAVLGPAGVPVAPGEVGELVIAGVGTGRYLDAAKDFEKFAPVSALGWARGYRSGDLVRADPEGLVFVGRVDDQVKLGGRRVELGEIDAALLALPGVSAAAAAVQETEAGGRLLVGYLVLDEAAATPFDQGAAREVLADRLPAALVPRLAVLDALPVRTSGKVDRAALPWPLTGGVAPGEGPPGGRAPLKGGTVGWLAQLWHDLLAAPVELDSDFFELGGTSLATARMIGVLRERYPEASVADVYQNSGLCALAARLEELNEAQTVGRPMHPTPGRTGLVQLLVLAALFTLSGLRLMTALAAVGNLVALMVGTAVLGPAVSWWWIGAGWATLISPPGRLLVVALGVRWIRRRVRPGCYPRGGSVHLRLWSAERLAQMFGIGSLAGTPLASWYARALGCRVGANVDLRSDPPVTGLAELGDGCAIEPEADLAGWWLDGDMLHVGTVSVGAGARLGARATLMPGARLGDSAEVEAGSSVHGRVPAGERWSGVPARRVGDADEHWPPPRRRRVGWGVIYSLSLLVVAALPLLAALPALAVFGPHVFRERHIGLADATVIAPLAGLLTVLCYTLLVAGLVRLAGRGLRPGLHATDSRAGWGAWLVERLMSSSRGLLFPIYASLATPAWFRLLGARIGRRTEISTATGLPGLIRVADGGFLADDTLVSPYEIKGGWLRVGPSTVGRRSFVGNSGVVGPGRELADGALIAVLSTAPDESRPNSSWVGRPAFELPRVTEVGDPARTFDPPARLVLARAAVETLRLVPWAVSAVLAVVMVLTLDRIQALAGWTVASLCSGLVLLVAGAMALTLTTVVKWLLVGRFRAGEHPLWSSFVWRNELFDVFYEELAMPWMGNSLLGTPLLNAWLRSLGARIGRGVWCESHWLPETDLVCLEDGSTVNRGCVLQTHLFHDRLMRIDEVHLGPGSTLGPHSILLPGASLGAGAAVGSVSLVMRGESVPPGTRWLGNPISVWPDTLAPEHAWPRGRGRHLAVTYPRRSPATATRRSLAVAAAVVTLASCVAAAVLLDEPPRQTPLAAARSPASPATQPRVMGPPRLPGQPVGTPGTKPKGRAGLTSASASGKPAANHHNHQLHKAHLTSAPTMSQNTHRQLPRIAR
ncbi:MAG TPA: Pls/PosA family non-ribosomal peptide synthetase [Pseudonocardia sp.]|uniref:Pls/PosA family non-ribosomal peptide synthetase n=1 Tax=Pseudonocardia sp. TaxID=60912 RepID=UPI002F3E66A0